MYNIKDMVKDNQKAKFTHYKSNELWYQTETGFKFPVPIEDTGDGIFNLEEKALLLMRYIRKHIKFLEDAEKEVPVVVENAFSISTAPLVYPDVSVTVSCTCEHSHGPTRKLADTPQDLLKALEGTSLEGCLSLEDSHSDVATQVYLRYDTGDSTYDDNWSEYCEMQDDLKELGWEITDVYIEHDCISGYLNKIVS